MKKFHNPELYQKQALKIFLQVSNQFNRYVNIIIYNHQIACYWAEFFFGVMANVTSGTGSCERVFEYTPASIF